MLTPSLRNAAVVSTQCREQLSLYKIVLPTELRCIISRSLIIAFFGSSLVRSSKHFRSIFYNRPSFLHCFAVRLHIVFHALAAHQQDEGKSRCRCCGHCHYWCFCSGRVWSRHHHNHTRSGSVGLAVVRYGDLQRLPKPVDCNHDHGHERHHGHLLPGMPEHACDTQPSNARPHNRLHYHLLVSMPYRYGTGYLHRNGELLGSHAILGHCDRPHPTRIHRHDQDLQHRLWQDPCARHHHRAMRLRGYIRRTSSRCRDSHTCWQRTSSR